MKESNALLLWQIYYETMRKVLPGEELLLGPKDPIVLDPSATANSGHGGPESIHDLHQESASNSSLTKMDIEEEDDEDDGVKCIKCDKVFHDIFM